jgi:hypothetical protein
MTIFFDPVFTPNMYIYDETGNLFLSFSPFLTKSHGRGEKHSAINARVLFPQPNPSRVYRLPAHRGNTPPRIDLRKAFAPIADAAWNLKTSIKYVVT